MARLLWHFARVRAWICGGLTGSRFEAATISPAPVVAIESYTRARAVAAALRGESRRSASGLGAELKALRYPHARSMTGPEDGPPLPTAQPPGTAPWTATDLPPRAQQLLAADDLDGYRRLFERIESIEDPHRRYWAGVSLIERGLACAREHPGRAPARAVGDARRAARSTCSSTSPASRCCSTTPASRCTSSGASTRLRRCSRRRRRLDPQLAGRGAQPRRARRAPAPARSAAAPGAAARRAARARAGARWRSPSAPSPPRACALSLCMIVRDEEEMLPRCLAAVRRRGRRDRDRRHRLERRARSRSRASFGARVIEHEWTGSFAEARNVSFDAATRRLAHLPRRRRGARRARTPSCCAP